MSGRDARNSPACRGGRGGSVHLADLFDELVAGAGGGGAEAGPDDVEEGKGARVVAAVVGDDELAADLEAVGPVEAMGAPVVRVVGQVEGNEVLGDELDIGLGLEDELAVRGVDLDLELGPLDEGVSDEKDLLAALHAAVGLAGLTQHHV